MGVRTHGTKCLLVGCQLAITAAVVGWLAVRPSLHAGNGGPELIVRQDVLEQQWVVQDEDLPASYGSVIEGDVEPGVHRLIRFTVMTPNIGTEDITLGDPNEHIAAGDGLFEHATCHQHYHFWHCAQYQLIDPATGYAWRTAKRPVLRARWR